LTALKANVVPERETAMIDVVLETPARTTAGGRETNLQGDRERPLLATGTCAAVPVVTAFIIGIATTVAPNLTDGLLPIAIAMLIAVVAVCKITNVVVHRKVVIQPITSLSPSSHDRTEEARPFRWRIRTRV
jgi:hypothetical protein